MITFRTMVEELDNTFLRSAEKCTSFNFPKGTFEKLDNKEEVRHLIDKHWLYDIDSSTYPNMNEGNLKEGIKHLKGSKNFLHLYDYTPKGVGPGEVMTYYLFDDVKLGGGKSAGVDVVCTAGDFELKGVVVGNKSALYGTGPFISNFKLGGKINLAKIITKLKDAIGEDREVTQTDYLNIKKTNKKLWNQLLSEYQDKVYDYFKDDMVIFFASKNGGGYKIGDLVYYGPINKDNMLMGNQTSGTIKPIIRATK